MKQATTLDSSIFASTTIEGRRKYKLIIIQFMDLFLLIFTTVGLLYVL
jgi:hypothetical protein